MLGLYNLPGKILANLWYLWPKKGQVWASRRRKDNLFVHFLYSSIIYAVLLYIAFAPRARIAAPKPQADSQISAREDPELQGDAGLEPASTVAPDEPLPPDPIADVPAPVEESSADLPPLCSDMVRDRCMNPSEAAERP